HVIVFALGLSVFQLPFRGETLPAVVLKACFTFALAGIGYAASLFSPNQVQAIQATMLIAVPSFLLSGFTWPFEAMPKLLYWLGHCLPLTYFVGGVRDIFVKGHGWEMIWPDCVILVLMGLASYLAAFLLTPVVLKNTADKKEKVHGVVFMKEQKTESFEA